MCLQSRKKCFILHKIDYKFLAKIISAFEATIHFEADCLVDKAKCNHYVIFGQFKGQCLYLSGEQWACSDVILEPLEIYLLLLLFAKTKI